MLPSPGLPTPGMVVLQRGNEGAVNGLRSRIKRFRNGFIFGIKCQGTFAAAAKQIKHFVLKPHR